MKPEDTQILATAIAYSKREIDNQFKILEQKIQSEITESEKQRILESAVELTLAQIPIKSLPDGLVYESHIQDLEYQLRRQLDQARNSTTKTITENYTDALSRILALQSQVSELNDVTSKQGHTHDYSPLDHTHNFVEPEKLLDIEKQLRNQIQDIFKELSSKLIDNSADVNQKISELNIQILKRKVEIESSAEDIESIKSKVLQIDNDISNTARNITEQIIFNNQTVLAETSSLRSNIIDITGVLNNKANLDYMHPGLAKADHIHADLATVTDIKNIEKNVIQNRIDLDTQSLQIQNLQTTIKGLLRSSDALQKSDLDDVTQKIVNEVLALIPTPKDGKDATEWEFRLNPQDTTILQFKKKEDKTWQSLTPHTVVQPPASFIGGGLGSAIEYQGPALLDVKKDGELFATSIHSLNFQGDNLQITEDSGNINVRVLGSQAADVDIIIKTIPLTGKNITVQRSQHNLIKYFSYRVIKSDGTEIMLQVREQNMDFFISSVLPLDGLFLQIRGI